MALLKPKITLESKVISLRISADLYSELEGVKREAERVGFAVPVNEVLTDALSRALKTAKAELASKAASGIADTETVRDVR